MSEVIKNIELFHIAPNPHQPRKFFAKEELESLANSIIENGVISPIIVKEIANEQYEIIAGERRWRASILAKVKTIPAIVRNIDSYQSSVQALIENIQRENLNPMEEALAYKALQEDYQLMHEDIAKSVGKSRSAVTNSLRLLTLPELTQELISNNTISLSHAKLLLSLIRKADILYVSSQIREKKLSIKETSALIDQMKKKKKQEEEEEIKTNSLDNQSKQIIKKIEEKISRQVSSPVEFRYQANGKGYLKFDFFSLEDLERLAEILQIEIDFQ